MIVQPRLSRFTRRKACCDMAARALTVRTHHLDLKTAAAVRLNLICAHVLKYGRGIRKGQFQYLGVSSQEISS